MIFNYEYVPHKAEQLQALVEHIVLDVWCNAKGKKFKIEKIKIENDFRKKVSRTHVNLKKPIHEIFKICSKFTQQQLNSIEDAFNRNNSIEKLCSNQITPVFYKQLELQTNRVFVFKVKTFFNNLYTDVFDQEPFHLNKHYNEFFQKNTKMCPCCGLTPLEATADNHREDYDHYLPKSEYLFNAVNLRNLIPICKKCNQNWKKKKNPIFRNAPVKANYYYSDTPPDYKIHLAIKSIEPCSIEIKFSSGSMKAEVKTWDYLFNLSERYAEIACHEHIGLGWYKEYYSLTQSLGADQVEKVCKSFIDYGKDNPLDNLAFLKGPFLEDCLNKGFFND